MAIDREINIKKHFKESWRVEMLPFQILGADFADFVDNNTLLVYKSV